MLLFLFDFRNFSRPKSHVGGIIIILIIKIRASWWNMMLFQKSFRIYPPKSRMLCILLEETLSTYFCSCLLVMIFCITFMNTTNISVITLLSIFWWPTHTNCRGRGLLVKHVTIDKSYQIFWYDFITLFVYSEDTCFT